MLDLSALVRDSEAIDKLSPEDCAVALQQCAALIIKLSLKREPENHTADKLLTAEQVAEKLNMSIGWVRDNTQGWLKAAKVKAGGALRFSEAVIDRLIRQSQGE